MKTYKNILVFNTLFGSFRMLVGATSVLFLLAKGLPESDVLLLKTIQYVFVAVFDIPISYWADRKSKKMSLLLASLSGSLWLFVTAFSPSIIFLFIGEVFNSLSLSLFRGASTALLINVFKKQQSKGNVQKIIALNSKLSRLGMIAGIVICGLVPFDGLSFLWMVSGTLLMGLIVYGCLALPQEGKIYSTNDIHDVFLKDIKKIACAVFSRSMIRITILKISIIAFFNIIINYNQIALYAYTPYLNKPYFHTLFFCLILLVQALASKYAENHKINIWRVLMAFVLLLFMEFFLPLLSEVKLAVFVGIYFFMMLIILKTDAVIHENTSDEVRSTMSSVFSTSSMIYAAAVSVLIRFGYSSIDTVFVYTSVMMVVPLLLSGLVVFWKKATL